jgi:hypothetical protein
MYIACPHILTSILESKKIGLDNCQLICGVNAGYLLLSKTVLPSKPELISYQKRVSL